MITKPDGYDSAATYGNYEKLSLGGHICKIKTARIDTNEYGDTLVLAFDIAEGSKYDGFYQRNFLAQPFEGRKWKGTYRIAIPDEHPAEEDEKSVSIFKTAMEVIEKSNSGYSWNWDENSLKGKLFGGVFGRKEYDFDDKRGNNRHGFYTTCRYLRTVEEVKNGVDVPEDKLLNSPSKSTSSDSGEFVPMPSDDDLPF